MLERITATIFLTILFFKIRAGSRNSIPHFGKKYRETSIDYIIEESPLGTGGGY